MTGLSLFTKTIQSKSAVFLKQILSAVGSVEVTPTSFVRLRSAVTAALKGTIKTVQRSLLRRIPVVGR